MYIYSFNVRFHPRNGIPRFSRALLIKFKVIDLITGKEANIRDIAVNEEWAEGLMYHDMEGFSS
jgi:hypothetical protein